MDIPPVTAIRAALDARFAGRGAANATTLSAGLVRAVDFPEFVADLLHGVFAANLDASVRQMDAYTDLVVHTEETPDPRTEPAPAGTPHALHAIEQD